MPIQVICPGCHARFAVSDKFGGKEGPCPKCKQKIKIPEAVDEVVVHAPDAFGPKDSQGQSVLRPISRQETNFSWVWAALIGLFVVIAFVVALIMRSMGEAPTALVAAGAIVLGPLLAVGGYTFLRNDQLEPYRGLDLLVRSLICGAVYAVLWGVYCWAVKDYLLSGNVELFQLLLVVPPMLLIGSLTSAASFEIDFGNGALHYGLYLLVTVLLRCTAGMDAF
jgi:hypothetical protein